MKYDDQNWHLNSDYPDKLNKNCAMTHMAFFITWMIDNYLESELLKKNYNNKINLLKERKINGIDFMIQCCDNQLSSDDFNELGNKFAEYYYLSGKYFDDYIELSNPDNDSIFEEPNNWKKYYKVSAIISTRYNEWRNNLDT